MGVGGRLHQRLQPDGGHGGEGEGQRHGLRGRAVRMRKSSLGPAFSNCLSELFLPKCAGRLGGNFLTLRTLLWVEPRKVWSMSSCLALHLDHRCGGSHACSKQMRFEPLLPVWTKCGAKSLWPL